MPRRPDPKASAAQGGKAAMPVLSDGREALPVAKALGLSPHTYRQRLRRGMTPDEALRPVGMVRRGGPVKPVLLADGRPAWPIAKAAGVSAQAFHYRLKAGWSPDDAVRPVGAVRRGRRANPVFLSDGREALPVALAAGVSAAKLRGRLRYGMPPDEAVKPGARFRLRDGRPAAQVARSLGMRRVDFWRALASGMTPDEVCAALSADGNGPTAPRGGRHRVGQPKTRKAAPAASPALCAPISQAKGQKL